MGHLPGSAATSHGRLKATPLSPWTLLRSREVCSFHYSQAWWSGERKMLIVHNLKFGGRRKDGDRKKTAGKKEKEEKTRQRRRQRTVSQFSLENEWEIKKVKYRLTLCDGELRKARERKS